MPQSMPQIAPSLALWAAPQMPATRLRGRPVAGGGEPAAAFRGSGAARLSAVVRGDRPEDEEAPREPPVAALGRGGRER
jgi:hypothetical protein